MEEYIVIRMGSVRLAFGKEEVKGLCRCSDFIKAQLEFADPDSEDVKEFNVKSDNFSEENLRDCFNYLVEHKYNPPKYGKVISRRIEDHLHNQTDLQLASKYSDPFAVMKLISCATYFQIQSLLSLCNMVVGVKIKIDPNDPESFKQVLQMYNITQEYNSLVEAEYKQKYEFLQ